MVASFLLALREGLEAALIIGIVLGVLLKLKRTDLSSVVWQGAGAAAAASVTVGLILNWLGMGFEGRGEEIFEGVVMLLAAGVLTWMIFWMHEHAGKLTNEIKMQTNQAARKNGKIALFSLAFLAVFREGIELALFLLATRLASNPVQTVAGAALGLLAALILGWVLFTSTRRLSLRGFFQVTNILLIIFAAGMVGLGVHELNEAGIVPAVIEHVWDLNPILDEKSELGQVLKALVGYNGNPSLTSVVGYLVYLSGISTYLLTRRRAMNLSYGEQANG